MSALLDWFDRYAGPKALNRAAGQWKCILAGLCPMTTEYGDTIDEAVEKCRTSAKKRRETFAEIERQDREDELAEMGGTIRPTEVATWEK